LYPIFKSGNWKVIGSLPLINFSYPKFISTYIDYQTKEHGSWYLIDEESDLKLGNELPSHYHNLEFKTYWPPEFIVDRIKTGKKPYEHLITTNIYSSEDDQSTTIQSK